MSAVLLLAAILGGIAATYFVDDEARLPARLCMGVPLGIVGFGLVGYLLGWAFGLSIGTAIVAAAIVFAAPVLALRAKDRGRAIREDVARTRADAAQALAHQTRAAVVTVLFYVFMMVLITRLMDRAVFE